MKFGAALSIWLNRTEQSLIEEINRGSMPFLGGYLDFLDHDSRSYFKKKLIDPRNPLQTFQAGLKRWPAVFATYLTIAVVEGYGKDSHAAVWPHVDKAIRPYPQNGGASSNNSKEELWNSYRTACIKIGIPVLSRKSGSQYMVNEFLNQAGVPLAYIENLVRRMIKYAESYGLPEENDTHAVKKWRLGLLDYMSTVQKPVTRALETDDTDYFPQLFLRYAQGGSDTTGRLEKIFHEKFIEAQESHALNIKLFKVPEVVWRDENICIEIPASEGEEWEVLASDTISRYIGLSDSQVITLSTYLPLCVEVRSLKNDKAWSFQLWESEANNRFLLFDEQGSFISSCSLADTIYHLEPGQYQVLSRFIPNGYDEASIQSISDYPKVYSFSLKLFPGSKAELSKGPASVSLQADSKPTLTWDGSHLKGVRGNELFASDKLSIQFQVPEELREDSRRLFIRLSSSNAQDEIKELPVQIGETNIVNIQLEDHFSNWKASLIHLTATIFREGSNRSLVRNSIYLWNGLRTITDSNRFEFHKKPENIDIENSFNINFGHKYLTFDDINSRFYHTVFNLGFNTKKTISFTWAVPGTFLYLEEYTERGFVERPLRKRSLLSIKEGAREALKIFSDQSGYLHIGSFSQYYNFSHSRYKRIPLLSLLDYITPDSNVLFFRPENCSESEALAYLASPQFVTDFYTERKNYNHYQVTFKLAALANEIEVKALNILDGKEQRERFTANNPSDILFSRNRVVFSNKRGLQGLAEHTLDIQLSNWESGAWLLSFKIKVGTRWHSLSNERQDNFSAGFVLSAGNVSSIETVLPSLKELPESRLSLCFKSAHNALLDCYSESSWVDIKWIKTLWYELGNTINFDNKQMLIEVLRLSVKQPSESTELSWIPICSINARFIEVYALPAARYSSVLDQRYLSLKILSLMETFSNKLTILFMNGTLYQTAAAGFSNFRGMSRGQEPQDFIIKHYKEALSEQDLRGRIRLLSQEDWQPSTGQYLGALHYLYALGKMKGKYLITLGSEAIDTNMGNHWRRGQALRLLKELRNYRVDDFVSGMPVHWVSENATQDLGLLNTEVDNKSQQEVENLVLIISGLSLIAHICRWESRSPGSLEKFKLKAKQLISLNAEQLDLTLGYLLFIGEDVFSFYLLLWELAIKAYENQALEID